MKKYYMPTEIFEDDNVVSKKAEIFRNLGQKALIVTGKHSAQKCGALNDVTVALKSCGIEYKVFDEVIENPPIELTVKGAVLGEGVDFIIGIGGGSPIDTAKGVAVLLKHGTEDYWEKLFGESNYDALPVVAIPTTCGTGTEVTPFAVFTSVELKTKLSMRRRVFPTYALIDAKYFMTMPKAVRNSTIIDAFSHAVESYISVKSNPYSELYALEAIEIFGKHREALFQGEIAGDVLLDFIHASTYAGVAIAQAGTSLPHALGYPVTYRFAVPHGVANAMFMSEYFKISPTHRVGKILEKAGFSDLADFTNYIDRVINSVVGKVKATEQDIEYYAEVTMKSKEKLKVHPSLISYSDVINIYNKSLNK